MKIHIFSPTLFFDDCFPSFTLLRNHPFYLNILINKHIYAVICIYMCVIVLLSLLQNELSNNIW